MRRVLLVSRRPEEGLRLAARWAESGDTVEVVLLDAAAAVTRGGHAGSAAVGTAAAAGAKVHAHDEALRRRGIADPVEGVGRIDLDGVAELVADGADPVLWT